MKKRNDSGRRRILWQPVLVCVTIVTSVLLLIGGTYAWFSASDSKKNSFAVHQYLFHIDALDEFTPPDVPIRPGDPPYAKQVGATNTADVDGFVRLLIMPVVIAQDEHTLLPANIGEEILIDFNLTDWADGGDGYFYYLGVVEPGQTTEALMEEVRLAGGLGAEYTDASLKIEVKCEAVACNKWEYRRSWWGSEAAPAGSLRAVDDVLSALAK